MGGLLRVRVCVWGRRAVPCGPQGIGVCARLCVCACARTCVFEHALSKILRPPLPPRAHQSHSTLALYPKQLSAGSEAIIYDF